MIALEKNASLVITDSGGVQEETTYLGVPCVSLPLMTVGGMPCGVQLIGARRDEGRLLATARWVEEFAGAKRATG